ncbi:membrane-targeted effector domain-containing toxin [Pseudomonas moorei]|uniref:membrane-targeted effector domain-containing toxin n=1 Tax=Pseudomonas moorei TaxID=395599 RepID=UPI001FF66535|nr:membrane-targeted effector domain-containing toxin [Pseudomonas moorei]
MNLNETRPLPNAADKAALKAIATRIVRTCPGLQDTAHEVASDLLKKSGITGLDPDQVYFHRFDASQSSSKAFTGWEHVHATPTSSMTLTQLVIHRFRTSDQDNADLLDVYAGFYTAGANAGTYNETNEVRLHGNEVLKAFWSLDFSSMYRERLITFWNTCAEGFRTLAKCNFLIQAVKARDARQLSDEDFQFVTHAVLGPITWPVDLTQLQARHPCAENVRTLDVDGHVAINILRFVAPSGRQIVYLPGEAVAFKVLETATDMHYWILQEMNEEAARQTFMTHFALADRQTIAEHITDIMNRLVSTWGQYDHHLINKENRSVSGDAFSWLCHSSKNVMFAEAELSLTSNGDLRKKLWIGYLSAGLKVFGPMAVVGWPVALPLVGASIASMGLNIDQAVNGKTAVERKAGILGAVLGSIDLLFNLLLLKGPGSLEEIAPGNLDELKEALVTEDMKPVGLPAEPPVELDSSLSETSQPMEIPKHWQANELLEGRTPMSESGQYQGIYQLDSNPSTAIMLDDTAYYVRYEADPNGSGTWAIIDPENPHAFSGSLPVRLNAQGEWELAPRSGLKGGGNRHPGSSQSPAPAPESASAQEPAQSILRSPSTQYDNVNRYRFRQLALGETETHIKVVRQPDGSFRGLSTYEEYIAAPRAKLSQDARLFFAHDGFAASLPPRPELPAVTPATTAEQLITKVFEAAPGLVIGESQDRIASMRFLIENMPVLARQDVKTIYFHRLLNDFNQAELDQFFKTGSMPSDLEAYLQKLQSDPSGRFTPLEVVKAAQQNGIRIQATDCLASYRYPGAPLPDMHEQAIKTYLTHTLMQTDKALNGASKWVVLTDQENINTFRGMPGISEMQGGIGLRIEEVLPEESLLIEQDRGIEVGRGFATQPESTEGNFDTLHADLSLQMPLPLLERTPEELSRMLFRQGMFTFEKSNGNWTLIHRSRDRQVVRTLVERTVDGNYLINRPAWTEVHQVPYANITELSWGLSRMGMHLEGRLPL